MTTRQKFEKEYPTALDNIFKHIKNEDYRSIEIICGNLPRYAIKYVITLLCDELINLTNEETE